MRLLVLLAALLVPSAAHAHLLMGFWGASSGTTWTENSITVSGEHTTNGGQTTSPAAFTIASWTQGQDYLLSNASTANWQVYTVGGGFPNFAPLALTIASKTGVQEVHASSGASLTITGSVGSTFNFPVSPAWENLTWIAVYTVSGSLGLDDLLISVCPQPIIAGPYTINEGAGMVLGASLEGTNHVYAWDLDGDGQYDDSTSAMPLFNAANLDGPATITIGLQGTATCGSGTVNTMTDDETVTIANVAPTITPPTAPTGGNEGDALSWTMSFTDPGVADTHTIVWDFGDGTTQIGGLVGNHTYADEGSFTLQITVLDDDGGSDTETLPVTIANVPPTITSTTMPSGNEGAALAFSAVASDPGSADTLTYTWTFGDGTGTSLGSAVSHTFAQDGTYTVTLVVSDGDGATDTASTTVTIADVPPQIGNFTVPSSTPEGSPISVSATVSDPGADTLTSTWSWGDTTPSTTGTSASHTFADDGSYTVTLTVSDQAGVTSAQSQVVTVSNVAPAITGHSIPSGAEGSALTFASTIVDPGADTLTSTWAFGDNATAPGPSTTHAYADEGSYAVTLTVSDGDGGTDSVSGTASIANVAPTIASLSGPSSGPEGVPLTWTANVTDPGVNDVISYSWSFGDGATATGGPSQTHTFTADGNYVLVVTVDDGDGGSNSAVLPLSIANGVPLITSMTAPDGDETEVLSFTATATDPDPLTYAWTFGDGASATGAAATHAYADDGTYSVVLTVTDQQGAAATQTESVTIANLPPVLDPVVGPLSGSEGSPLTWTASATDPSANDPVSFSWDWGDGTAAGTGAAPSHAFADDGTYTVVVTADDGDGGTDTESLVVTVSNVAPTLVGTGDFTATEGVQYGWTPTVTDPGADTFAFSFTGPGAMTQDSTTGALTWTPTYADALGGPYVTTLTVTDDDGGADTASWGITVSWADGDGDGMADGWEVANNLDPADPTDATADADADGVDNLAEFLAGTDPASYDGPSAPTPLWPDDAAEVSAAPVELRAGPASDPQNDPLTLTFEVYADDALTTLLTSGDVPQDGETTFTVDVALAENADAYWRVRAADAAVAGPWSEVRSFFFNEVGEAPPTPTLVYPLDGETVSLSFPALTWVPVEDADRDPVRYRVEVFEGEALVTEAYELVAEDAVEVAWTVDVELTEDTDYAWRVAAYDDDLDGAPTELEPFFYSRANSAPTGVTWISPMDGAQLDTRSPVLEASEGVDVEGDPVGYLFEFASTATFDDPAYTGREVDGTGTGVVAWDLERDGIELPYGEVFARVRGVDPAGASSKPDAVSFTVLGGPEPTPEPTPDPTPGGTPPDCEDCGSSMAAPGTDLPVALLVAALMLVVLGRPRSRRSL